MKHSKAKKVVISRGLTKSTLDKVAKSSPEKRYPLLMRFIRASRKEFSSPELFFGFLQQIAKDLGEPEDLFLEKLLFYNLNTPSLYMDEKSSELSSIGTKELILSAALDVFSRKGYYEATVDEIAKKAGVAKGSIYRYFSSKEDLLKGLIESRLNCLSDQITSIVNSSDDVIAIIENCVRVYIKFFDDNRGIYELLFREKTLLEAREYTKKAMKYLAPLKLKILKATAEGVFKPLNFQVVFYGFMGFVHGLIQKWVDHGCSYNLSDDVPIILEVLFHGTILPAKFRFYER